MTDKDFQKASDGLAREVGGTILKNNFIPSAKEIIEFDVRQAVNALNLEPWQWAGTIGDLFSPPYGLGTLPLTPGMAVTAEITTRQRRLISYFLTPLEIMARESLHER